MLLKSPIQFNKLKTIQKKFGPVIAVTQPNSEQLNYS